MIRQSGCKLIYAQTGSQIGYLGDGDNFIGPFGGSLNGIGPFGFGRFESFGVAYIQTIKAIMPVLTLVLMFALKLEKSSPTYTKIIISSSVGIIIASVDEMRRVTSVKSCPCPFFASFGSATFDT